MQTPVRSCDQLRHVSPLGKFLEVIHKRTCVCNSMISTVKEAAGDFLQVMTPGETYETSGSSTASTDHVQLGVEVARHVHHLSPKNTRNVRFMFSQMCVETWTAPKWSITHTHSLFSLFSVQAVSPNPARWPRVACSSLAAPSMTDKKLRVGAACLLTLQKKSFSNLVLNRASQPQPVETFYRPDVKNNSRPPRFPPQTSNPPAKWAG